MLRGISGWVQPLRFRFSTKAARKVMPALMIGALALGFSACAKQQAPVATVDPRFAPQQTPSRVAGQVYYSVETEDDGMEAQHPPVLTRASEPDDPTEPFSPNYGRAGASISEDQQAALGAASL
jgi:hypothetical protein